jgi:hypothetical protein
MNAKTNRAAGPLLDPSAVAGARDKRPPDFFIVGQPKSGTTALYEMLRRHPQIYMPENKEPWFLATELHERPPPRPGGMPRTLAEYLSLFDSARPGQLIGEASPLYLWSRTAAERIFELQPTARIIAVLREPASLLRSLHLQFVRTYVETENDLRKALSLEQSRREGRNISPRSYWPQALLYSEHVRYVEQLRRFERLFGSERMLVLVYDDFRLDNEATVRRLLRFLELDDTVAIDAIETNPTVGVRSQRLHRLVRAMSVGRGPFSAPMKGLVRTLTPRRMRREALVAMQRRVLYATDRSADEELALELRGRYRGEVTALSEYLGRDLLTLWGFGELD